MIEKIKRPTDPYSPLWSLYWKQNPGAHRGVGADATGGEGAGEGGGGEGGGESKPGVTDREAELLKDVMKKKGKIKELEDELIKVAGQLKQFEGVDPVAIKKLIEDRQEEERKALEAKGDWDRLKVRMAEEHGREVQGLKDQLAEVQKRVGEQVAVIDRLTLGHAFDASKLIAEELIVTPSKARVIYGDHFEVQEGRIVAFDKPKGETSRTPLVDGRGMPLSFEEALRRIVDADPDKDRMIKSKAKPGAKSGTNESGSPGNAPLKGLARIQRALEAGKAK